MALDTNFAPAWAALSVARTRLFQNSGSLQGSDITRARFAAQRALALDSTLPNARAAMAGYYSVGEHDEARALRELRIGLRSSPRDASLLTLVALSERARGQSNRRSVISAGEIDRSAERGGGVQSRDHAVCAATVPEARGGRRTGH